MGETISHNSYQNEAILFEDMKEKWPNSLFKKSFEKIEIEKWDSNLLPGKNNKGLVTWGVFPESPLRWSFCRLWYRHRDNSAELARIFPLHHFQQSPPRIDFLKREKWDGKEVYNGRGNRF